MSSKFASKVFEYRSYTPIPWILVMFFWNNPNLYSIIAGLLMAVAGELIRLWGVSWAGSETRTTSDGVGSSYLVVSGPFSHVRNPLYIGNILMYVGIGIMSNALSPYLQIASFVFFAWQYHVIVGEEEAFLKTRWGAGYEKFCQNVPRFIPRLSAYKDDSLIQPKFSLAVGLKSESRTFQAFGAIVITIIALWFFRRLS